MRKSSTKRRSLKLVTPPKQEPASPGTCRAHLPVGYREGDDVFALTPDDDTHAHAGLYAGDRAVCVVTKDVTPDDIAVIRMDGECWLGTYRPGPGGYMTFEGGCVTGRYRPGAAELEGRVCHVERKGVIIRQLRPIRDGGAR